MKNARRAQRADLLQLDLSPWRGRETARANPSQMASGNARGVNFGALAEGDDDRGVYAGSAASRVGGVSAETQSDALFRSQRGGLATVAREKVRSRDARQRREDLFARSDGQSRGHRQGGDVGGVGRSVRDMESRTSPGRECGG